ncbi:hypothetical protein CaCOL14_010610 [Colletotrichum acutatum]
MRRFKSESRFFQVSVLSRFREAGLEVEASDFPEKRGHPLPKNVGQDSMLVFGTSESRSIPTCQNGCKIGKAKLGKLQLVQLTRLAGQITSKISRHRKGRRLEVWAAALICVLQFG